MSVAILCRTAEHKHVIGVDTVNFKIASLDLQGNPNPYLFVGGRIKAHIIKLPLLLHSHNIIQHPMNANNPIEIMFDGDKWGFLLGCYYFFDVEAWIDWVHNFRIVV